MDPKQTIILKLWEVNIAEMRQMDVQRNTISAVLGVFYGAIISYIGTCLTKFEENLIPTTCGGALLIILGVFGMLVIFKLYERYRCYKLYATCYMEELSSISSHNFKGPGDKAENEHRANFQGEGFFHIKLYIVWILLHFCAVIMGLTCVGFCTFSS